MREVSQAILPLKRVTTVEGRAFGNFDLRGETLMDATKSTELMGTKLMRIASLSHQDPRMEFKWLMPHFTRENLISCFHELDGTKAVGIDGRTKNDYGKDLERNIDRLIQRMRSMSYKPAPVREVLIPKSNGKFRPLGISNIEDKIVQLMCAKILESVFDPIFCECSYGFRRNKSTHKAVVDTIDYLKWNNVKVVIDVDLENYFGTIRHKELIKMLDLKIQDKKFLRLITRMLKAGAVTKQGIRKSGNGVPQGSIVSPILANIYAHYAIDLWFARVVPKHIFGKVGIFRFCDDFVICSTDTRDSGKIINSLGKRLAKFGLMLNKEKTKIIPFNRYTFDRGVKQGTFDFLGFTFYLSRARRGFITVKVKTSKKTFREKLKAVRIWVERNRFAGSIKQIWLEFCRKLQGHIVYFGVTDNCENVVRFLHEARRVFFKWMNRRSQRRSLNWEQFTTFEREFPMPRAKIYHNMYRSVKV